MAGRHLDADQHVQRHLDRGHQRNPAHPGADVRRPVALGQPLRALPDQFRAKPGDRVGGVLQDGHAWGPPRRGRLLEVAVLGRPAHLGAVVEHRLPDRRPGVPGVLQLPPQWGGVGRAHQQRALRAFQHRVEGAKAVHVRLRAQAQPVGHQLGTRVGRQCQPLRPHRGEQRGRCLGRQFRGGQRRHPTRGVRVLQGDRRGVPGLQVLHRVDRLRLQPARTGGGGHHQHLPLETAGSLQFADGGGHPVGQGAAGRHPHVHPNRCHRRFAGQFADLGRCRPAGDEVGAVASKLVELDVGARTR